MRRVHEIIREIIRNFVYELKHGLLQWLSDGRYEVMKDDISRYISLTFRLQSDLLKLQQRVEKLEEKVKRE